MFGMFKRNAVPADLSKLTVKDIEVLLKKESPQEAGAVLRRAAKEGSTDAAVFLSTMLDRAIQVKGKEHTPKQMLDEYVLFTEMAANRGDLGSQFNIAKHYVSLSMKDDAQMDEEGYETLKKAEAWYRKSAEQGFEPSVQALGRMQELFEWAHGAFGTSK